MSDWHHPGDNTHLRSVPVHRGRAGVRRRAVFIALGIAVLIVTIIVASIWSEKPRAKSAAGALPTAAATVTPATATPGTPVPSPKPVEKAAPLAAAVAGDGSWLIGKQIKRGTYRTTGSPASCYWALRSNLSYSNDATIVSSYGRRGAQTVALGPNARAFITYGCGRWELVNGSAQ